MQRRKQARRSRASRTRLSVSLPYGFYEQSRVRNDRLVPAVLAARAHQVEDAQVLEAKSVARRHGQACPFVSFIVPNKR
jgi:hypothetical protein